MSGTFKAVLALSAVFAAGLACGAAGVLVIHHHLLHRAADDPAFAAKVICRRMERAVDLDAAQSAQCRAEVSRLHDDWKALHDEMRPRAAALAQGAHDRMRAALRPEQREKFDRLLERWRRAHDWLAPPWGESPDLNPGSASRPRSPPASAPPSP